MALNFFTIPKHCVYICTLKWLYVIWQYRLWGKTETISNPCFCNGALCRSNYKAGPFEGGLYVSVSLWAAVGPVAWNGAKVMASGDNAPSGIKRPRCLSVKWLPPCGVWWLFQRLWPTGRSLQILHLSRRGCTRIGSCDVAPVCTWGGVDGRVRRDEMKDERLDGVHVVVAASLSRRDKHPWRGVIN